MGKAEDFGSWLKGAVGDAGLTVADFAKAIGCHVDAPQKWFTGKSFPHRKYHKKISDVLRVPRSALLVDADSVIGSVDQQLPVPELSATMKAQTKEGPEPVDPLLTQTLLSIQLRLDKIERSLDEIRNDVRTHQHPLSYRARKTEAGAA